MATRSIGTVTGATVLMLLFQGLQARGFMTAFQTTFRTAALIPAALILFDLRRGRWSR